MTPISEETTLFILVVAGAVGMEMFCLAKGFHGAKAWLNEATNWSPQVIHIVNGVIVVAFGSLVGVEVVEPATRIQALSAGLGWVSLLNVGAQRRQPQRASATQTAPEPSEKAMSNGAK